jgi:hypothetical protein
LHAGIKRPSEFPFVANAANRARALSRAYAFFSRVIETLTRDTGRFIHDYGIGKVRKHDIVIDLSNS